MRRMWRGKTDDFCCTTALFSGDLLRRSLDFWYCVVPDPVSARWLMSEGMLTIEIARYDVDGFTLCKDISNFFEFPIVSCYK